MDSPGRRKSKPKQLYQDPNKDIDRLMIMQGTAIGASIKADRRMSNRQLKKQLTMASASAVPQRKQS